MAKSTNRSDPDQAIGVLKDMLIVQLGLAGVPQQNIQKIVGCGIERVNTIVKHLRRKKNASNEGERK